MSENPYEAPKAVVADAEEILIETGAVARAQRMLLLSVLACLVSNILLRAGGPASPYLLPVFLAVAVFSFYCVYRLCRALRMVPWLWLIAMFIPLVNLICLVVLNQKATATLKAAGIRVGLLGARQPH